MREPSARKDERVLVARLASPSRHKECSATTLCGSLSVNGFKTLMHSSIDALPPCESRYASNTMRGAGSVRHNGAGLNTCGFNKVSCNLVRSLLPPVSRARAPFQLFQTVRLTNLETHTQVSPIVELVMRCKTRHVQHCTLTRAVAFFESLTAVN